MEEKVAQHEPSAEPADSRPMRVLIASSSDGPGKIWHAHLVRIGAEVELATGEDAATEALRARAFDIVVNDLAQGASAAFAIADFAGYRRPDAQVIFVTPATFFSETAIFNTCANACALVRRDTPAGEIAAIAEHHAKRGAFTPPT